MTLLPHAEAESARLTSARPPGARSISNLSRIAGWCAHLFTALGAGLGFLALGAAADRQFAVCFAWLGAALLVDGADGALARRLRVRETAPFIDGALLDLVVDYVTYVMVPLFAIWRSQTAAPWVALACAILAAVASALYFADGRMKTADHWFRGFPGCWNLIALYYFAFQPPLWILATAVPVATALMFGPFASVHPLRVVDRRPLTVLVALAWLASAALAIAHDFRPDPLARTGLALTALYFIGLSVWRGSPSRLPPTPRA